MQHHNTVKPYNLKFTYDYIYFYTQRNIFDRTKQMQYLVSILNAPSESPHHAYASHNNP